METKHIHIPHIARVEGHGNVTVSMKDGEVHTVNMEIYEGTRFFEEIVKGRGYEEVPPIMSRICAICTASHRIASILAIEDAFGVIPSQKTELQRELYLIGNTLESHSLHVFLLALPDIVGYPSAIAMANEHPEIAKHGLALKKLGNTIQEVVSGRAVHGENAVVGGFGKFPSLDELKMLKDGLSNELARIEEVVKFWRRLEIPNYTNSPNLFSAISTARDKYCLTGETIAFSNGDSLSLGEYKRATNEFVVSHSHAKHSLFRGKTYAVGALARLVINGEKLEGEAGDVMRRFWGTRLPKDNIIENNTAQLIEIVWCIESALTIIGELFSIEEEENGAVSVKEGEGVGGVEAPRGTLYHSYKIDKEGKIEKADVITPTAINLENTEKDMRVACENNMDKDREELGKILEMIVRAYDPCISCATHLVYIN